MIFRIVRLARLGNSRVCVCVCVCVCLCVCVCVTVYKYKITINMCICDCLCVHMQRSLFSCKPPDWSRVMFAKTVRLDSWPILAHVTFLKNPWRIYNRAPIMTSSVLQSGTEWSRVLQCVALSCSMLQCVAVRCSVWDRFAVFAHSQNTHCHETSTFSVTTSNKHQFSPDYRPIHHHRIPKLFATTSLQEGP